MITLLQNSPALPHTYGGPVMMMSPYTYPEYARVPVYTLPPSHHPPTPAAPPARPISEEDLKQVSVDTIFICFYFNSKGSK